MKSAISTSTNGLSNHEDETPSSQSQLAVGQADLFQTGGPAPPPEVSDITHSSAPAPDLFQTGAAISSDDASLIASLHERYEHRHCLGSGGMGDVWEVFDREKNKHVALKRMKPELLDAEHIRQRFFREVETLKSLHHPGIVKIFDDYPEQLFFTMEKLEGQSLREVLVARRRVPLLEALRYMLEIVETLRFAHQKGLIHRDLKPENIFILRDGPPHVKLLDFGIALDAKATRLTSQANVLGTAYYMAPEQLHLEDPVGPGADIFACGVVLYEMLVGRIPIGRARPIPEIFARMEPEECLPGECPTGYRDIFDEQLRRIETLYIATTHEEPDERISLEALRDGLKECYQHLQQAWWGAEKQRVETILNMLHPDRLANLSSALVQATFDFPESEELRILRESVGVEDTSSLPAQDAQDFLATLRTKLASTSLRTLLKKLAYPWRAQHLFFDDAQWCTCLAFRQLLGRMAVGIRGVGIQLIHWKTGYTLQTLPITSGDVLCIAMHPQQYMLASGGRQQQVMLWDMTDGSLLRTYKGPVGDVVRVLFHPEEERLFALEENGTLWAWTLTGELLWSKSTEHPRACVLALHPDGDLLVTGGSDGALRLWDVEDAALFRVLDAHAEESVSVSFSSDGTSLLSCAVDGSIGLWDMTTGMSLCMKEPSDIRLTDLSFVPGDEVFVTASRTGTLQLWDAESLTLIDTIHEQEGAIHQLCLHTDRTLSFLQELKGHGRVVGVLGMSDSRQRWMEPSVFQACFSPGTQREEGEPVDELLADFMEQVSSDEHAVASPHQNTAQSGGLSPHVHASGAEARLSGVHSSVSTPSFEEYSQEERPHFPAWYKFALGAVGLVLLFGFLSAFWPISTSMVRGELQSLKSGDRLHGLRMMLKMSQNRASALLPEAVESLSDDSLGVRIAAARVFLRGGEASVGLLQKKLSGKVGVETVDVLYILGTLREKSRPATSAIAKLLGDPDRVVSQAALRALCWIRGDEALPHLIKAFQDRRHRRVPSLLGSLRRQRRTPRWKSRRYSRFYGGDALFPLRTKVPSAMLNRALLSYRDEAATSLTPLLLENDPYLRRDTLRLLGRLRGDASETVPQMIQALSDQHRQVRIAAARALGFLGAAAKDASSALEGLRTDRSRTLRRAAARSLSLIQAAQ
tara:strand:- start:6654 stop:10106 length:3453 start_codon:yes stop_codon:yes gene_type:complete